MCVAWRGSTYAGHTKLGAVPFVQLPRFSLYARRLARREGRGEEGRVLIKTTVSLGLSSPSQLFHLPPPHAQKSPTTTPPPPTPVLTSPCSTHHCMSAGLGLRQGYPPPLLALAVIRMHTCWPWFSVASCDQAPDPGPGPMHANAAQRQGRAK